MEDNSETQNGTQKKRGRPRKAENNEHKFSEMEVSIPELIRKARWRVDDCVCCGKKKIVLEIHL